MNVTQIGQNVDAEGAAMNSTAEAVRGLARDRTVLVREWKDTNRSWVGYSAFAKEQQEKIDKIDRRIDQLLMLDKDQE